MADIRSEIKSVIDAWGIKVVDNAHKVLNETIPPYTMGQESKIAGSVGFKVFVTSDGAVFNLTMNKYWINIEDGRGKDKKAPPTKPIEQFIRLRNLRIEPPKTLKGKKRLLSEDRKIKSLAFVIARSIGKKGIKPRPFQNKLMTQELKDDLTASLLNVFKQDFILSIKE